MIRFFEDVFPAMLGIQGNMKGATTSNTDMEAIIKAWLTSGELNAQVLDTSEGRTSLDIRSKCGAVINAATNASLDSASGSMKSRYQCNTWQSQDRIEGGGLIGKANKKPNQRLREEQDAFIRRMRRNQSLIAVIFHLIYVGILPEIDLTAANIIFSETLKEAKAIGLSDTDDIRNYERLQMVCRVLVVLDAIGIIWDAPDSIIGDCPHEQKHFLLAERYLRSNVEHAVLTLGLLNNQYENVLVHTIIKDLMKTQFRYFKDQDKASSSMLTADKDLTRGGSKSTSNNKASQFKVIVNKKGKKVQIDTRQQQFNVVVNGDEDHANNDEQQVEGQQSKQFVAKDVLRPYMDDNYYYAPLDFASIGAKSNTRIDNNVDRVKLLANHQYKTMEAKPLPGDLRSAYETLLSLRIKSEKQQASYNNSADDDDDDACSSIKTVPALDFTNGYICISRKLVKDNKIDALKRCTEKVINHKYAKKATYLYGVSKKDVPFFFETIKVGPDVNPKGKKVLKPIDPNYFDRSLIAITERFNRHVHESIKSKKHTDLEKTLNDKSTNFFARKALHTAFSTKNRIVIDCDLNDSSDWIHSQNIKYDMDHMTVLNLPTGDPLERARELIKLERERQAKLLKDEGIVDDEYVLVNYPKDLPHSTPVTYYNNSIIDARDNPQKYSYTDAIKARAVELQRDFIATYGIDKESIVDDDSDTIVSSSQANTSGDNIIHDESSKDVCEDERDVDDEDEDYLKEKDIESQEDDGDSDVDILDPVTGSNKFDVPPKSPVATTVVMPVIPTALTQDDGDEPSTPVNTRNDPTDEDMDQAGEMLDEISIGCE